MNFIKNNKYVALLIGVSTYSKAKLNDIPNVKTNVEELKKLFLDKRYIGVSEKNLITSFNESSEVINRKITDAVNLAKNSDYTLFVYFSGHGIISPSNFNLYFATANFEEKYLEDTAINAKNLLGKISRSVASRKIFVVDACHSGQIHNTMGDMKSNVASIMKEFEGVHYVTACSEMESALYPKKTPNAPTYFTGAIVSRVQKGLDIDKPYLTLRDIVDDISVDFKERNNLPVPQQSCVLNADQMPFALNVIDKDFSDWNDNSPSSDSANKQSEVYESEWKKTLKTNTLVAYYDYIEKFPKSPCVKMAENKVVEIEEENLWSKTQNLGTLFAYETYKKAYPVGKYLSEANAKISEFKRINKDNDMWNAVCEINTVEKYRDYLAAFPSGCHADEAVLNIDSLLASKNAKKKFLLVFAALVSVFVFMMPNNSGNENFARVDSLCNVHKDTVKHVAQDSYCAPGFNSKSDEQKADALAKDELYYHAALELYIKVYAEDTSNITVENKIKELKAKINNSYDTYMESAEIFLDADYGVESAVEMYEKALRMKPGDRKATDALMKIRGK